MGLLQRIFGKAETRATGTGYTSQVMTSRAAYITGRDGAAELTATVQGCVSLWESGLSLADVQGTDVLTRRNLALAARALALRGEAVFYIAEDRLIPATDWDLTTRLAQPVAYRLTLPDTGGGRTMTALAGEVLHFRIGSDVNAPYSGQAPLRRSGLTAGLLHHVETALAEAFQNMPLGSQIVPMPEMPDTDMTSMAGSFRGNRGNVLIRESVNVSAAGGPAPVQDWKASDVTPDLSKAMTRETLSAARDAVQMAFGVLPGLASSATTGPMVREAQRHLAQWTLQPLAMSMAEEATEKLGAVVDIDTLRPLQAYDAGGRARAAATVVQALGMAKEAGVDPDQALKLVNWGKDDGAA
ncbi:hypothetical protein DL1_16620 [Thioclava dalianensis]|uniref:Phage portal protein n=1 Tax=Thioclava dalianensis TaxID=1185766 RepID=A0A074U009_9RHOB|nr:phage portal protein [Thioclava dalianensis]KEP68017.1 hypothetical protein DL1_16620 [Thioclava dalianensis]SFN61685.1 Phage portal protein [Thioclava dalianensis]